MGRELGSTYAKAIENAALVEVGKVREGDIEAVYFVEGIPAILVHREYGLIPSLYHIYKVGLTPDLPSVYVDAGATPRILNGADVMVPGIRKVDGSFEAGSKVLVREIEKGRPLAVGVALMSSSEISGSSRGKAVLNVHYVGDEYWYLATS